MAVAIPDDIMMATRMTEGEMMQEIAVMLFAREKLTIGQASHLAGMTLIQFQHLLASRKIPVHYDVADFEEGFRNLREVGHL